MSNQADPAVACEDEKGKGASFPFSRRRLSHSLELGDKSLRLRNWFYRIWTVVGVILIVGVVVFLLGVLSVPVSILLWTAVFVLCLKGMVAKLDSLGLNRTLGAALAYVAMFVTLGLVGFLMFSPVFGLNNQIANLLQGAPDQVSAIISWLESLYGDYSYLFQDETVRAIFEEIQTSITGFASSVAQVSATGIVDVGTAIANGLMAVGFALVIAFWILIELPGLGRELKRIISPERQEEAEFLRLTFTRIMGGYIKGTLIQCAIIGVLCGIVFAVLGISNAAALGVITGVLNIIPIVGPWLGGAVAAGSAVFVSPLAAVISLIGTIIVQQVVYTFVSPKIMADSVDIHPMLTLFALMCGSAIGGAMSGLGGSLVGMLISIPAVAVVKSCFVYYFERHTGRRVVANDGVFFKGNVSAEDAADPLADATSTCQPAPDAGEANQNCKLQ